MKPTPSVTAVSRSIELTGGAAPEWVELLPAGPEVEGRDGRKWRFEDAAAVAAASYDASKDIPIDYEHATEIKAPEGEPAPAAGWIKQLEARPSSSQGSLWGKVEWTERGGAMVAAKEYRYLSPVFLHSKDSPQRILQLLSAGLTNSPNLALAALNREGEGGIMGKEILKALGLSDDATAEQAAAAINSLKQERDTAKEKAKNSAPSLDKFVPRADYDTALERATNAEVDAEVAKALEAGKITPATKDYHAAQCKAEGGLERFKEYVKAAPEVAPGSGLGGRKPSGEAAAAMNADEKKIAAMFGNSAEDLKKHA